MKPESGEITRLLSKMKQGDPEAEARVLSLVYRELRLIAARYMRAERPDHSLQPTALVHEAYLRLHKLRAIDWQSRTHFLAVSAHTMRRILVDHARAKKTDKRGVAWTYTELDIDHIPMATQSVLDMVELDEALNRLAAFDVRQARIVEMRFFGGLTEHEIGMEMGLSERTVKREWRIARAWLYSELSGSRSRPSSI